MDGITITWLGHACFWVEACGYSIVLDPYKDGEVFGLSPLRVLADQVNCSHGHLDHCFTEGVEISESGKASPFHITVIDTYHDDANGSLRGENHITVLEACGYRVAHFGDLGCGLSEEQLQALEAMDAVMIPVGGFYTIDAIQAQQLVNRIQPRVVIPMHYKSQEFGYEVLDTLDSFTSLRDDVVVYQGNTIKINGDTKKQTAVLSYLKPEKVSS